MGRDVKIRPPQFPSSLAVPSTNKHLWLAAIKPPMYTVAITPMTVGTLSCFCNTNNINVQNLVYLLFAAVLIIGWLNLSNDAFDFDTGVDKHKKESIVNLLGGSSNMRHVVLILAHALLLSAFALLYIVFRRDYAPLIALACAVFGGYAYQGPPFRLGYKGLGELICFTAWFIATTAVYYSQAVTTLHSAPPLPQRLRHLFSLPFQDSSVFCTALLVAYPTTLILFCSHFHQIRDDAAVGKKSPIVRMGTLVSSRVFGGLVALFAFLQAYFFYSHALPLVPFILSSLTFPLLFKLAFFVCSHHDQPNVIRVSKYKAVVFHFAHGMLLSLGYLLQALDVLPLGRNTG